MRTNNGVVMRSVVQVLLDLSPGLFPLQKKVFCIIEDKELFFCFVFLIDAFYIIELLKRKKDEYDGYCFKSNVILSPKYGRLSKQSINLKISTFD